MPHLDCRIDMITIQKHNLLLISAPLTGVPPYKNRTIAVSEMALNDSLQVSKETFG